METEKNGITAEVTKTKTGKGLYRDLWKTSKGLICVVKKGFKVMCFLINDT